jgi:predicted DNA-binding transcriptional regulator AlpA
MMKRVQLHKPEKLLLRKREVAEMCGVSVWTVPEWVKAGILPPSVATVEGAPERWLTSAVLAAVDKLRTRRKRKRAPRGRLKRGTLS